MINQVNKNNKISIFNPYYLFSIIYPLSLIFCRLENFFIFGYSISAYLSILFITITFSLTRIFQTKDKVFLNCSLFLFLYAIYIIIIDSINSATYNEILDISLFTNILFSISFSYILIKYPQLINKTLNFFILSFTFLALLQSLGIGLSAIQLSSTSERLSVLNFHVNEIAIIYSANCLLIIDKIINLLKFKSKNSLKNKNIIKISIYIFTLILNLYSLFNTGSRAGLLIIIIGSLLIYIYIFLFYRRNRINIFSNMILLSFIFFITVFLTSEYSYLVDQFRDFFRINIWVDNGFGELMEQSIAIRKTLIIDLGKNIFDNNFLFGIGREGIEKFSIIQFGRNYTVHNGFMEIFAYGGLIALLSIAIFIIFIYKLVYDDFKFRKDLLPSIIFLIIISDFFFSVLIYTKITWFFLPILIAKLARSKKEKNNRNFILK